MTVTREEAAEAERLLAAQLDDLVRYRQILEAQRAVLRLKDAGLLDAFSREADDLVADISARDVRLLAIRKAAALVERPDHRALRNRIETERFAADQSARLLADQIATETGRVARAIAETSHELDGVLHGYARRPESGPTDPLFERRG